MSERKARPSGFVAKCRCGVYVASVDILRTPADDARTMLGRWLWDGLTVEPRFGSWVEKIGACQCGKGGEDADEIERLMKRVEELEEADRQWDKTGLVEIIKERDQFKKRIAELELQVAELEAKLASYDRADRDLNEALNMGDGRYIP